MIAGVLFLTWRCIELLFLIPLIGMLSYLVHGYTTANLLTPTFILVLFIVSVLAGVWALVTLIFYVSARHSGYFIAFVDLCIFAALIAGVVVLRGITGSNCSDVEGFAHTYIGLSLTPFAYQLSHACGVLKASFAFAIINIMLFFTTTFLALLVHHHHRHDRVKEVRRTSTSSRRHSGGSRSGSRYRSHDDRRRSSRGPPRSRSRGHYSSRHSYV